MVKRRRDTHSFFMHMSPENLDNLKSMSGFIKTRARETIVVLDNNILPYLNRIKMADMSDAAINAFAEFNNNSAELIRDFCSDRVIVTPDVREEIKTGVYAAASEIKACPKRQSLDELLKSFDNIERQLDSNKRQSADYGDACIIFDSFKEIARSLVLYVPGLKKDAEPGKNETDEKMVAYAFAQGVKQEKKVCIFSEDRDVLNLSKALYFVLTAKSIVGTDAKVQEKLINNNIEVYRFDAGRQLYGTAFDGKNCWLENRNWDLFRDYCVEPAKLVTLIRNALLPAEIELGNGKALAAMVGQGGAAEVKPAKHVVKETAENKAAEETCSKVKQQASAEPSDALERIYQRLKVNPADLDNADQSRIEDAIKDYEALISVYSSSNASASRLEKELEQIKGKSFAYQLEKLTEETRKIQAEAGAIYTSPDYISSESKQAKFEELNARIKANSEKIRLMQSSLKQVQSVSALESLSPAEKELYDSFKSAGFEIKEEGVWVSSDELAEITQRVKTGLYTLIGRIEQEVGIERNSHVRPAQYRIELKHLHLLVRKR